MGAIQGLLDGIRFSAFSRTWTSRIPALLGRLASIPHIRNTVPVQLTVAQITERLLESYHHTGGINHLDGKNLPSKRAIADITMDLLRLLFPGFFDEKLIHSSELKAETSDLVNEVLGTLEVEVAKSLEYNPPPELQLPKRDLKPIARTYTLEFLASLPRIRDLLQ